MKIESFQSSDEFQGVFYNLDAWEQELFQLYLDALFSDEVQHIPVSYAQEHHVWQNRTYMAEETLHCFVDDGSVIQEPIIGNGAYLVLAHGAVDPRGKHYGKYLETMQGGRFAILNRTLQATGIEVYNAIADYVMRNMK